MLPVSRASNRSPALTVLAEVALSVQVTGLDCEYASVNDAKQRIAAPNSLISSLLKIIIPFRALNL